MPNWVDFGPIRFASPYWRKFFSLILVFKETTNSNEKGVGVCTCLSIALTLICNGYRSDFDNLKTKNLKE